MQSSEHGPLIPRKYQEEIFNRAMSENIIAALDTGSGKTYIAVLLIRWMAARSTGSRKIYVFLVPRVPLVEQQKDFIAEQMPLTVRGYYGELVDQWEHDPVRWTQEFNECDIMVMTAQVFLDAMLHAHWSMSQVALIVFDEAHHTRKNHPYNQIMRDFYSVCHLQDRPKVLGMTASPIWNPKQPERALKELEDNLHAKVIGVMENQEELLEHSPRPDENIREYTSGDLYPTYPISLWNQLVACDPFSHPTIVHENLEIRYSVTLAEIGPYGADFYLFSHLSRLCSELSRKYQYEYLAMQDKLVEEERDLEAMSVSSDNTDFSSRLVALEGVLAKFSETVSFDEALDIEPRWLSSKLQVLVSILVEKRSKAFQAIVFVEQRQIASTLAWILPRIPQLKGWVTTGALVGHGAGRDKTAASSGTQGMLEKKQRDILNAFRDGSCNLLISTSVGEEGLDFQACDLIVRYNKLQNLVGYVQSRGRARRSDSTYIVMIPKDSHEDRMRYASMRQSEPAFKEYYRQHHRTRGSDDLDPEELEDPVDIACRERYEVLSTGAVLTYGSAISLLSHLCAIIPRDKYTAVLQPTYVVDQFESTVELPSALPVPRDQLVYKGPPRRTKREAKAAVAFIACKALHRLGVFDDYLLPARKTSGAVIEDADGQSIPQVGLVSEMIDVMVVDPWSAWYLPEDENALNPDGWVHEILVDEFSQAQMGIVLISPLDSFSQFSCELGSVQVGSPLKVSWPSDDTASTLRLLQEYTAICLRWCNTGRSIQTQLTCFFTPLTSEGQPDFEAIRDVVKNPTRRNHIFTHEQQDILLLQSRYAVGRPLILRGLREDLTPLSRPSTSEGSGSDRQYETFVELFQNLYGGGKRELSIPTEGPMLLVETYVRNFSSQYPLHPNALNPSGIETGPIQRKQLLIPASICEACVLPEHVHKAFRALPQIIRRITDVYRARAAVSQLKLPPLLDDLVVEALTLPCATAGFNNQRLETLGDSVLKVCVVVHLYNKYPFRHEGQLDGMRMNSVSNRVLLARAREVGLERFLTCEPSAVRKWRPTTGDGTFIDKIWHANRRFARRSLQDCMEALLGVSFLTGGINMTLHTGTALRLCFGGTEPWNSRYVPLDSTPIPTLFKNLQHDLGYEFKSGELLMEAATHPSFQSQNSCYQRLEFLGDALLDLLVIEYLFKKFPSATSGQLSWARSRAVCAPALTTVAVKQLALHKYLLSNNVELGKAIWKAVPVHSQLTYEDIVLEGWKYDPPKALSDIMESVSGAIFVDTGFDYEQTKGILLKIMAPLLEVLGPKLPRDPTSELMLYLARNGCRQAKFEKFISDPEKKKLNDSVRFRVHGVIVGSPLQSTTGLHRAKPLLAQMVRKQLEDPISQFYLENLCNCKASANEALTDLSDVNSEELNDETEEEFAVLSLLQLRDADGVLEVVTDCESESGSESEEEADEANDQEDKVEVERMMS